MTIIESFLKLTPFFNSYKKYIERKAAKEHQRLEAQSFPLRVQFYKQFIHPGDLVFDVGANVGNRAGAFLECNARVIAIEPQPACAEILKEKFGNKIVIESVGLSEEVGELEMQIANDTTVSSFSKDYINKTKDRFKYSTWQKTIKVPVTTLENIIKKYGIPRFCKIDVEGYELEVLKGLKSKIPFISIEYCVPEMQEQLSQCINYLNTLTPEANYNYSVGESMKWAFDNWKTYEEFSAHINEPEFIHTSFGDIYVKNI